MTALRQALTRLRAAFADSERYLTARAVAYGAVCLACIGFLVWFIIFSGLAAPTDFIYNQF